MRHFSCVSDLDLTGFFELDGVSLLNYVENEDGNLIAYPAPQMSPQRKLAVWSLRPPRVGIRTLAIPDAPSGVIELVTGLRGFKKSWSGH